MIFFSGAHLVHFFSKTVRTQNVYVIVIWVSGGYGRPYKASKDVFGKDAPKSSKYYYIRKFSSTIIASNEEKTQNKMHSRS